MKTHIPHHLAALVLAVGLASAPALKANSFNFEVTLNTAGLVGAAAAPFYLDFQLNEGSGTVPNSVTLSDFSFLGGSSTGTPQLFGDASGSLAGTVTLDDNPASPFNEFLQGFSDGTTSISFDVSVSQTTPGVTPDGFFAAILDSEAGLPQIPTTAPDGVSLVALDLGASDSVGDVHTYASLSPIVTASVPDGASTALLLVGSLAMLLGIRRLCPGAA